MSSAPGAEAILATYEDHLEALERVFRTRTTVIQDRNSRFHGLTELDLQTRLEKDREELDRWVVLLLVASFEATLRTDLKRRAADRPKHPATKALRELVATCGERIRLDDILEIWEAHVTFTPSTKQSLRKLLKHRHWLAHGRYWTNRHGPLPAPWEADAALEDYVGVLFANTNDFPLI